MSSLIVEVVKINDIVSHPNADRLEIAHIKGWSCIVQKDEFKAGDKGIYFPIDAVLPVEVSDKMGVTKYLSKGRIRAARLRGFVSYGLLIPCEDPSQNIGDDLIDHYGVTKYEPPLNFSNGLVESPHPRFHRYTDIENHKNFPDVIQKDEIVVVTEKIHGTNSRVGFFDDKFFAGSHNQQLKEVTRDEKPCLFWLPLNENVRNMLKFLNNAILFCEIFGSRVQKLNYGLENGVKDFRAIDIFHDDHYLDWKEFKTLCNKFNVQVAPVLYEGPYNFEKIHELAQGNTTIENAKHIREGVVFKPVVERWDDRVGRVILKHKSDEYELNANRLDNDKH